MAPLPAEVRGNREADGILWRFLVWGNHLFDCGVARLGPFGNGNPGVRLLVPAARVGDLVVCVGPPDVIALGSFSVLIGGMPAARLGDMTVHGGAIVMGYPTVLIG